MVVFNLAIYYQNIIELQLYLQAKALIWTLLLALIFSHEPIQSQLNIRHILKTNQDLFSYRSNAMSEHSFSSASSAIAECSYYRHTLLCKKRVPLNQGSQFFFGWFCGDRSGVFNFSMWMGCRWWFCYCSVTRVLQVCLGPLPLCPCPALPFICQKRAENQMKLFDPAWLSAHFTAQPWKVTKTHETILCASAKIFHVLFYSHCPGLVLSFHWLTPNIIAKEAFSLFRLWQVTLKPNHPLN